MTDRRNFAFLDENSKKEIRRKILKAIAIPGYQVPFASRELPIARGWGTGGLQLSLSLVGPEDKIKVIDQGSDDSMNAVNIRSMIRDSTGIEEVTRTQEASLIQSRHRIPETPLREDQILVLQVPLPEPLRKVEPYEEKTRLMHAYEDYSLAWVYIFEEIIKYKKPALHADYPVMVNDRYLMAPSPIPRFDNPKLHMSKALILLGAGREKKIYAVPPYTKVESIDFEDYPFETEDFSNVKCHMTGATGVFMDELEDPGTGQTIYQINDQAYMLDLLNQKGDEPCED